MVKRHYVGHTLFLFPEKQLRYNILSLSVGLIVEWERKQTNKQASYWYTFRLLNFIFHQILITYNSITLTLILKFLPFLQHLTCDFQIGHAFLQERIQVVKKKPSWEGAPKKMCVHKPEKKMAEESEKGKLIDFRRTWNKMSLVICVLLASEHNDATLKCHSMCVVKRHHTHNSVFYFLLYFLLPLLHHIFCTI